MNERIKELAVQARDWGYAEHSGYTAQLLFEQKFALLIVRECLMIVYERQVRAPTDDDGYFKVALDMVSTDIEQHFGVEE